MGVSQEAMQHSSPEQRSIQVTLLLDGRVAGERLLPLNAPLVVGPRPRDTFSIPHLSAPVHLTAVTDGTQHLLLAQISGGTLRRPAGTIALGSLWRPDGRLPLQPHDEIVADLGAQVSVQLSFSPRPPEAAPVSGQFRPQLLDEGGALWLGSLATVSALAAALLIFVLQHTPQTGLTIDEIPERIVDVFINPPPTEPSPPSDPTNPPASASRTVEDVIADPGGQGLSWGRRGVADRSALLRALSERELLTDWGLPLSDDALREILSSTELSDLSDALDDSVGAPRSSTLGEMGDVGIGPIENIGTDTPRAALANQTGTVGDRAAVPEASVMSLVDRIDAPAVQRGPSTPVRIAMRGYRRQVRYCFESALTRDPSLSGRLMLELDIVDGQVTRAHISENTSPSRSLAVCMTRRAMGWSFPAGVTEQIEIPFSFN